VNQTLKDAAGTYVPLEVYLRSSEYEPDAEYIDGKIEERPVGEADHNAWQQAIQIWFFQHMREWNIRVRPKQSIRIAENVLVPDVTVYDRSLPNEQVLTHPPIAVFEVLSPEDTLSRLKRKLEIYRTMGIPEIWVIDPEDGSYSRYEDRQLTRRDSFSEPSHNIVFEMVEIKKLFDES
jgi:Uma2 family endonuclease